MSRARTLPVAVLFVALAAAAASCSSGGGTHAIKASPAAPSNSRDLALAQKAVLRPSDLSDYNARAHTPVSELSPALKSNFAQCMGTDTTIFDTEPGSQTATSPDFSKGDQNEQQVTSSVEIDPTTAEVDQGWKAFTGAKTMPCLKQLMEQLFTSTGGAKIGLTYGPVQVSQFNVGVGDRSIGYEMSRPATGPSQTIEFDVDIVYVVRGRAGMEFHYFNYGKNPDRAVEKQLAQKVYDRIGDKAS